MSYRALTTVLLALSMAFAGIGLVQAQASKDKNDTKEEKKDDTKKSDDGKSDDGKKEDKYLSDDDAVKTMKAIEKAWNKLKANLRNHRGDVVAEQADIIQEHAEKFKKYDGEVLTGDDKGKKARDQKDFKKWMDELIDAAKDISKYAKKSKWDKVDKAKETLQSNCGDCHDVYQPKDDDD